MTPFELGNTAGYRDEGRDKNPFIDPADAAEWLRGYEEGDARARDDINERRRNSWRD